MFLRAVYAQKSLSALLGREFDCLVSRDRPDLQSTDNHSMFVAANNVESRDRIWKTVRTHLNVLPY